MKIDAKLFLTGAAVCCCLAAQAQESKTETANDEPKGNAIVRVFGDFRSGFGKCNDDRGFNLERSYLGYEYKFADNLSVKAVVDAGKSSDVSDYQRLCYIKNAMVTWKTGGWKISGGLISTIQFDYQEKFWGGRYIMKSFQDEYKFGSSADLGVSAAYKFADWLSADLIVVNGEGYKKIQVKDGLNYGMGVTVTPVKGLSARFYGSVNESVEEEQKNTVNYATFLGYKNDRFSIGAEYNIMQNASYKDGNDKDGFSIYSNVKITKRMGFVARYDNLTTEAKDGQSCVVAGLEWKLGKYVKITPNFRFTDPEADGEDNRYYGFVNFSFGL